jgi:hypothetical protein
LRWISGGRRIGGWWKGIGDEHRRYIEREPLSRRLSYRNQSILLFSFFGFFPGMMNNLNSSRLTIYLDISPCDIIRPSNPFLSTPPGEGGTGGISTRVESSLQKGPVETSPPFFSSSSSSASSPSSSSSSSVDGLSHPRSENIQCLETGTRFTLPLPFPRHLLPFLAIVPDDRKRQTHESESRPATAGHAPSDPPRHDVQKMKKGERSTTAFLFCALSFP